MALTNYQIGGANPGGTHTIQDVDTQQRVRYYDLAMLAEGFLTNLSTARPGVLPGPADSGQGVPSALLCEATGSGLNVSVRAGSAVVERATKVGSYLVVSPSSAQVTLATADSVNSRVDRIDLQVFDGLLGDNGGVSLTQIVVTSGTGTPSGGVIPIAPAPTSSIPLGTVLLPANTATVTAGMITRTRRSAALRGAVRIMLEGDSLTDPGFMAGELRDTSALGVARIDRWDNVGGVWRLAVDLSASTTVQVLSGDHPQNFTSPAAFQAGTASPSGPGLGLTFRAPASGNVKIDWSAGIETLNAGTQGACSIEARTGGTIGSGTVVFTPTFSQAVASNTGGFFEQQGMAVVLQGLTPGTTYNVRLMFCTAGTTGITVNVSRTTLIATPVA